MSWTEFDIAERLSRNEHLRLAGGVRVPQPIPIVGETRDETLALLAPKANKAKQRTKAFYPIVGMCKASDLPVPIAEYRFDRLRRWSLDFAWPLHGLALEIEGGAWTEGRHVRGEGFIADMAKYNAAALAGYRVLRYTPDQIRNGAWLADVADALGQSPGDAA